MYKRQGFVQLHANAQWFHGFDADSRLIVRGEAGRTFTGDLLNLPPSLRYFAGGDRSVRGYGSVSYTHLDVYKRQVYWRCRYRR